MRPEPVRGAFREKREHSCFVLIQITVHGSPQAELLQIPFYQRTTDKASGPYAWAPEVSTREGRRQRRRGPA
jgi:hypothetical protein